ncbi:SDR family NAD(P)-dependent oxidoreductase [Rubrivirga marina]|uniref:Short-chain dehydrogenase n=1 Tax=Rubrivirga marina TaxID=1196024 RepID=A0A271IZX2_9BACT|nr:SDR family NAD(P)-dependent oxidoreductase [Rubrivirga marina]PAP76791.1 hypothetical protein BSZ37_10265 [Rubrivirga marina]
MESAPTHSPSGPDGRPTALVTGSNGGLGLALAKQLAADGWRVLLHGRDPDKLARARATLAVDGPHAAFRGDLSTPDGARDLARRVAEAAGRLDVLIHNAGTLQPERRMTEGGVELTMALNALAPFVLTEALHPLLLRTAETYGGARVVTVSSEAQSRRFSSATPDALAETFRYADGRYSPIKAYGRSKLAATVWTLELARRLDGTGVTANACHPGVVRTGIFMGLGGLSGLFAQLFSLLYLPPSVGARCPFVLATAPEYGERTGRWLTRSHVRRPHEADPPAAARAPTVGAAVWDALSRLAG